MPSLPPDNLCHPGLLLDKWHACWSQDKTFARDQLRRVVAASADQALLRRVLNDFGAAMSSLACERWKRRTSGPLTLHLSRAGSFENAGICLHPIYGFAYLPGTGLKGLARFYARNVARATTGEIEAVFGKDTTREEDGSAGAVVFYDALPVQWPKLLVDIVNNHHGGYYDRADPPGDWEEPVPVNFLAVAAGTEFEFFLGVRRGVANNQRLLELARGWIDGALLWLGAGAKTNAGYGRFSTGVALPTESEQSVFTCAITLLTPAFFAGALQEVDDCNLRPATMRGLLRWWWRTLHAGHLTARELLRLERLIWGGVAGTTEGDAPSALSISVEPMGTASAVHYRKQEVANAHGLKKPDRQKATLGIAYISYGMDEKDRSRYYLPEGSGWRLTILAKPAGPISGQQVLDQARAALWLLTNFGGVGSKSRKGFGCLQTDAGITGIEECRKEAAGIRAATHPSNRHQGILRQSPSLESMLGPVAIEIPGDDVWYALDQLGDAIQEFAQAHKHNPEKKALGLPRRMKEADSELRSLNRHSSPVHFHLGRSTSGFNVSIVAFPSEKLRSFEKNREFLQKFIEHLQEKIFQAPPSRGRPSVIPSASTAPPHAVSTLRVGTIVEATLLAAKTNKGGWKAQETVSGLVGPIQNTQAVPSTSNVGDVVKLKVKVASPSPAFEYLQEAG
jgi:CRISPR-associated protein Cmr6